MKMLSDDDLNLRDMTDEELAAAWDLWFTLAQATNDTDPEWTHGVFVNVDWPAVQRAARAEKAAAEEATAAAAPRERATSP